MKQIDSPQIIISAILPLDELCVEAKDLSLLKIEVVRRDCQSIYSKLGDESKVLVVGDENNCLPPQFFSPSSPRMNYVEIIKCSVCYKLRDLGGVGKAFILGRGVDQRIVGWV